VLRDAPDEINDVIDDALAFVRAVLVSEYHGESFFWATVTSAMAFVLAFLRYSPCYSD
jgi:uncharacterized MAPEG superfamily protein